MLRKMLFALLLSPLVFSTSCKKTEDNTPIVSKNQFIINGIHDVDLITPGNDFLVVGVSMTTGEQEPVTLSVTGLPEGVTAEFSTVSGTPSFGSTITFKQVGHPEGGNYPIHLVGKSASYTKSYDLNISVPVFSGITVDGEYFEDGRVYTGNEDKTQYFGFSSVHGSFECRLYTGNDDLPADGTYTYPIDGTDPMSKNAMNIKYYEGGYYYRLSGNTGKSVTIKKTGKQLTITFPEIEFYNDQFGMKTLVSAKVNQQIN